MITIEEVLAQLNSHCIVTPGDIMALPRKHARVGTKFLYPDGSGIDLFVEMGSLLRPSGYAISDFGGTLAKLAEYQMDVKPKSRTQTIIEMSKPFGVELADDRLIFVCDLLDQLGDGLICLGQACISVASLVHTRRNVRQGSLSAEVEMVIRDTKLKYQPNYEHAGPYERLVQVDYRVEGPSKASSVLLVGSRHEQAADAFGKWSDLIFAGVKDKLLTIYDDREGYKRTDDLSRLERISEVVSIKNPKMIEHSLLAA